MQEQALPSGGRGERREDPTGPHWEVAPHSVRVICSKTASCHTITWASLCPPGHSHSGTRGLALCSNQSLLWKGPTSQPRVTYVATRLTRSGARLPQLTWTPGSPGPFTHHRAALKPSRSLSGGPVCLGSGLNGWAWAQAGAWPPRESLFSDTNCYN